MNLNKKIKSFLNQHKNTKKRLSATALLSLLIAIAVVSSLIMPAISMTLDMSVGIDAAENSYIGVMDENSGLIFMEGNRPTGDNPKPADDSNGFSTPCDYIPKDGTDFSGSITGATITIGGQTVTNGSINVTVDNNNPVSASFNINYTIQNSNTTITKEHPCIYYKLPDGIVTNGICGSGSVVYDDDDRGFTGNAGFYSITTDGFIVIQFTEKYIDEKVSKGDALSGHIQFNGNIKRADTASGDQTITIGGATVNVDFPDASFSIDKSGQLNYPANVTDKPKITWTITVDNPYPGETNSLNGYKVYDERFPADKSGITVDPLNAGDWDSEGNFVFNRTNPQKTTFTFTEPVEDYIGQNNTVLNNAVLKKPDNTELCNKQAQVQLIATTISKQGRADLEDGKMNNEIEWTVTVDNPLGYTLKETKVNDAAFSNATIKSVKDESGNDVSYTQDGNTITFDSDVKKAIIKYTTSNKPESGNTVDGNKVTNTAKVIYSDGKEGAQTSADVMYTNPYTLNDKTGSYAYDTGEITWTVGAQSSGKFTLNGYTFTDEAFKYISIDDIKITEIQESGYQQLKELSRSDNEIIFEANNSNSVQFTITLDKTEGKIVISGPDDRGITKLNFTYTTDAQSESNNGTTKSTETGSDNKQHTYVSNTVGDNQGHSNTAKVDVTPRDSISKSLNGTNSSDTIYNKDAVGNTTNTLKWKTELVQDGGFSGENKIISDVMSADNGGKHYITAEQQSSVKIYAKTTQSGEYILLGNSLYELKFYDANGTQVTNDNAVKFEVKFKQGVDEAKYKYVKIEYETTADYSYVPNAKDEKNESAVFSNKASFGTAGSSESSYTITKKDENYIESTSIEIKKNWYGDNDASVRPDSIKFRLQRRADGSDEWETIYKTDNVWSVVNPVSTDEYTYSLTYNGNKWNWNTIIFSDLPKETSDHSLYYYRAVEADVPDGYRASYSSDNGVNSGDFTITNTKHNFATYDKTAINKNKAPVQSISPKDLNKVTVNEKEYYAVGWKVAFENNSNSKVTLIDTLPQNHVLLSDYSLGETASWDKGELKYPAAYWQGNQWSISTNYNDSDKTHYKFLSDEKIQFDVEPNMEYIIYYTGIPVEDVDAVEATDGYIATNSITSEESGVTKEASVKITSVVTHPLLDKKVNHPYQGDNFAEGSEIIAGNGGRIQYTIKVNPEGKKLSNTSEYDVTDEFIVNECNGVSDAIGYIDAKLNKIIVKNTATNSELSSNDYQYTVEYKPITKSTERLNLTVNKSGWNFILKGNSAGVIDSATVNLQFTGPVSQSKDVMIDGKNVTLQFDGNGHAEYCWIGKISGNEKYIGVSWGDWNEITDVEVLSANYEKTTINSSAVLHITVPDEMPLEITYEYDLTNNGQQMANNTKITTSNSASLNTGNVSASDSESNTKFAVQTSDAGAETGGTPKILKYDINDYSLKLDADFLIAKYDSSKQKWVFASVDNETTVTEGNASVTKHELIFDKEAEGDKIPDGVKSIQIQSGTDYKVVLDSSVLYKIIEVKAPSGYQGSDDKIAAISNGSYSTLEDLIKAYLNNPNEFTDVNPYYTFLNNFVSTHYFTYGNENVNYPNGVDAKKVIQVKSGGSLDIPNNQLIDIAVQKSWSSEVPNASSSVKLYWSYTKSSTGIPSNAIEVKAEDLGLQSSDFENPKTINASSSTALPGNIQGATQGWSAGWNDLPSGKDDKPIYYYVKEESYTLHTNSGVDHSSNNCTGCTTYTLDYDGKYRDSLGVEGRFKPSYTGNATNKDGIITITNSEDLKVVKFWQNSDGSEMSPEKCPADAIKFVLYGKISAADAEQKIGEFELTAGDNWEHTFTAEEIGSYTTGFRVKETYVKLKGSNDFIPVSTALSNSLEGYTISEIGNTNGTTGLLSIINKAPDSSTAKLNFTVKKTWVDGGDSSRPSSLTLKLQQSSDNGITWTDYNYPTPEPTKSGNEWIYSYSKLPADDGNGTTYHYRVVETVPSGYKLTSEENNKIPSGTDDNEIRLTNTKIISLKVKKEWSDTAGSNSVNVMLYRSTTPRSDSDVDIIQPVLAANPESVSIAVNETADVTVNKAVSAENITIDDNTIASADVNGKIIKVTGRKVGTTTMHISDGKNTVDVTVNVSAAPTLSLKVNDSTSATITAGNTATLSVSMSDGSSCDGVTYTVSPTSGVVSISGSTVTGVGTGTATITAAVNGTISNEVTIIVEEASSTILKQS
ncbi:MAG: Cna B-type domain-containing protein, partial [Ruminococcus sp.]